MEVILREAVEKLGHPGDIVKVSAGYPRNFLLPRGIAYIVLISSILNFQTVRFEVGNDSPYLLYLPTYTATAWYHKKLPADLQNDLPKAVKEARDFAAGDYARALEKGSKLAPVERAKIVQQVARLTGLSPAFVEEANLRIQIQRFCKELLRGERRTVGRLDSRLTGIDRDSAGETIEYDPSYTNITGPYTAAFNDYVRRELNYQSDMPYEILKHLASPSPFPSRPPH